MMRKLLLCAVAASLVTAASAGTAVASAPTTPVGADTEYCAVLVGKPSSIDGISPIEASACSPSSASEAHRLMMEAGRAQVAARTNSSQASMLSSDLLMTAWENTSYTGSSTNFYGSAGPCDASGYSLHLNTGWFSWGDRISSAAGTSFCRVARFHTQSATYARQFRLPTPDLGATLNDNVDLVQIWRG